jgi:predicted amidohydrolase
MPDTVIACCQIHPVLGDVRANREITADAIHRAAAMGAGVIVLPELASSGYAFTDTEEARSAAEPADGPTVSLWSRLARDLAVVVVAGFCELDQSGAIRNSAAIVDPTGVRAIYRKAHLWDAERLIFEPGDERPPVIDTAVGRLSMMICYDLKFPEWVRLAALSGAQLLCAPVNWPNYPRPQGERPGEVIRVQADAAVNRMFIAACDRVGVERGLDWVGGSTIVDPDGWPLAGTSGAQESTILTAPCHLADADHKGVGGLSDIHGDRRPSLYSGILE